MEDIMDNIEGTPERINVEFTGGEPFIRKDILSIVKMANKRFDRVKYSTNGAAFANKSILSDAVKSGVKIVYLKFYSVDSDIHEKITRINSLHYVMQGLDNLACMMLDYDTTINIFKASKFVVIVQIPVNSLTLRNIEETVDYISRHKFTRIILDFRKTDVFDEDLLYSVKGSIQISKNNQTWPVTYGIPPCILVGAEENTGEIYRLQRHVPGYTLSKDICCDCAIYSVCPGVPDKQIKNWNLRPIADGHDQKIYDLINISNRLMWSNTH